MTRSPPHCARPVASAAIVTSIEVLRHPRDEDDAGSTSPDDVDHDGSKTTTVFDTTGMTSADATSTSATMGTKQPGNLNNLPPTTTTTRRPRRTTRSTTRLSLQCVRTVSA